MQFHTKHIQYSTWCQNRGCSYISSTRRIYRSNPAVSCISPSILNNSTVELQFYYQCKVPLDPGSSEQFYPAESSFQVTARLSRLPMCSSPCFQAFYTAESSFYAAKASSRSLWSSCVAVEEEFEHSFTG